MGISLSNKGWGCWKNKQHRGRSPTRLVARLLRITELQAATILNRRFGTSLEANTTLLDRARAIFYPEETKQPVIEPPTFPSEIKPILPTKRATCRPFTNYLLSRGYDESDIWAVCGKYSLRYALSGPFAYRIVIPVYDGFTLATWTGRAINSEESLRYWTLTSDPLKAEAWNLPPATKPITDCLFNEPALLEAEESHATCLFGKVLYDEQLDKLVELSKLYDNAVLLLDSDTELDSFIMIDRLKRYGFSAMKIPRRFKDPGEMTMDDVRDMLRSNKRSLVVCEGPFDAMRVDYALTQ